MTELWLFNRKCNSDKKKLTKYRACRLQNFVFRISSQETLRQYSGRRSENYKQLKLTKSLSCILAVAAVPVFLHCKFRVKYTHLPNSGRWIHWNIFPHQSMQVKSSNKDHIYKVLICPTAIVKLFLAITSQNWKWSKVIQMNTIVHQHKFCNFT